MRNNVGLAETKQYHAISISTYGLNILQCTIKQDLAVKDGRIDQYEVDGMKQLPVKIFPELQ